MSLRCVWIEPSFDGPDAELYRASCAVRERVLLSPIGLTHAAYLDGWGDDTASRHVVAVTGDDVVVGVSLVRPGYPEAGTGKVSQVAVEAAARGLGAGRALMAAAAGLGRELGLRRLMCHAQQTAVGFYERVGWCVIDDPFEEVGIPHRRMEILL